MVPNTPMLGLAPDLAVEVLSPSNTEREMQRKLLEAEFNLEDFLEQLQRIRNMGPLQQILELIPGLGSAMRQG